MAWRKTQRMEDKSKDVCLSPCLNTREYGISPCLNTREYGMQDISKDACLSPCLNSKENMACIKIEGCMSFDKGLKENCHLICTKEKQYFSTNATVFI